jgi:DNA-binding MarR family transcriptional regulator
MSKRVNFADLYDLNLSRPVPAPPTVTAPVADTGQITETAPSTDTAEIAVTVEIPPASPQIAVTAESTVSALVTHPEQYYSAPNELDDRVMPTLRPGEQVVLRRIYRLTRGFHKATCSVSVGRLARACNISEKKAGMALNLLEDRGFIRRIDSSNKGKTNEIRGLTIECLIPEAATAKTAVSAKSAVTAARSVTASGSDNKKTALKENNKKGDELLLDTKNCPDCQGTGYCYPEGNTKGVKRCEHSRL